MKEYRSNLRSLIMITLLAMAIISCKKEDEADLPAATSGPIEELNTPSSYEFFRDGNSTVSYSGQTDRLNQLQELKNTIQAAADNRSYVDSTTLFAMFENQNGNANGNFSFSSSKQLKDKTFDLDKSYFDQLLRETVAASDSGRSNVLAQNGKVGLMMRKSGSAMLLNQNGHELTQAIEKGLMGATFYHQIVNVYLSDSKIGPSVNNKDLVSGENYTAMEHHMDEALGYFGAPVDFTSNYQGNGLIRYWAKYSYSSDALLGLNSKLMNAYKLARAAIVANNRNILDAQVRIINEQFEVLIAATTIHYINQALNETHNGERIHQLSEAFYFLKALRYSNISYRKFSQSELDSMLYSDFGENLWQVNSTGLNNVKNKLSNKYNLSSIKDQL